MTSQSPDRSSIARGSFDHVGFKNIANRAPGDRPGPRPGHARPAGPDRGHVRHLQRPGADQQPNYAQSLLEPQADELIDFALSQLISDTERHPLGRSAATAWCATCTATTPEQRLPDRQPHHRRRSTSRRSRTTTYNGYRQHAAIILTTNIVAERPQLLRLQLHSLDHAGGLQCGATTGSGQRRSQTFEILADSGFSAGSTAYRTLHGGLRSMRRQHCNNPTFNNYAGRQPQLPG